MKLFMDLTQGFVGNVSVNLSGADVGMAQHHLNTSYVCAI